MSLFDPVAFFNAATDVVDERRGLLPEENPYHDKGYYLAKIGEITPERFRGGVSQKGKKWARVDIPVRIQVPPALATELSLDPELTIIDGVMLDLDEDGNLDERQGKNSRRRIYREATDTNVPGFKFDQLSGKIVLVRLKHDIYNDQVREQVAAVFRA